MLASLLPGLRDVRTPLTVGYLWLVVAWLIWADDVPRQRPDGDGIIARAFDLGELVGPAASIAALSFAAYLLGVLLTVPTEHWVLVGLADIFARRYSANVRHSVTEYQRAIYAGVVAEVRKIPPELADVVKERLLFLYKDSAEERARDAQPGSPARSVKDRNERRLIKYTLMVLHQDSSTRKSRGDLWHLDVPWGKAEYDDHLFGEPEFPLGTLRGELNYLRGLTASMTPDLRVRLLTANQELYGEYDRLATEATFRLNLCLPSIALSGLLLGQAIFSGQADKTRWAMAILLAAVLLGYRGLSKIGLSLDVIRRAVIAGVIKHPSSAIAANWIERAIPRPGDRDPEDSDPEDSDPDDSGLPRPRPRPGTPTAN